MRHIFFRIYAGIVIAVAVALLLAAIMISNRYEDTAIKEKQQLAQGTVHLIREALSDLEQRERARWFESHVGNFDYPIDEVTWFKSNFTDTQNALLAQGAMIVLHDSLLRVTEIYAAIQGSDFLLKIGPISDQAGEYDAIALYSAILALIFIGLAVFFLVHPIEVRLKHLETTTNEFAHGDLHVRTPISGNDAVGSLEETFNYMADRIVSLIRAQQELTNAVSHELRTPIARLRFGLDMIGMSTSHDEQEERLKGMDRDLSDLDHLIDELLMYARLGAAAPKIQFEPVNMNELIEKVCTNLTSIFPDIEFDWKVDKNAPQEVLAEPKYLQRAIHNLVSNGSRYANKKILCTFSVTENDCVIAIEDDGPGIPEDERARVFSPFTRLDDSRTRKTGGYGLGLAIVRRIVRWHKGKIWIESSSMQGARFVMTWPRRLT